MTRRAAIALAMCAAGICEAHGAVWHWQECADPTFMRITVEAGGERLLETTIPTCHLDREDFAPEKRQRMIEFPATRLATALDARASRHLTGNVWEAGAEPDGLALGISFQSDDRIHLNTLHFAALATRTRTQVAPGVFVETTALPRATPTETSENAKQ